MRPPSLRHAPIALLIAAALAPALARTAAACSQCLCGSPTPPGYLLQDPSGRLSYGIEERYLSKENALAEEPGSEQQTEHRISALLRFRPAARVSLQARLPYVTKELEERVDGEPASVTREAGLGDFELAGRFDALRLGSNPARPTVVALAAAITAPTGPNDRANDMGERLEAHLQPGTGAWSGTAGFVMDAARGPGAFNASLLGRTNGASVHGYRYGDVLLYNAGYARTLSTSWEAALELNGRSAERDHTEDGTDDPNSGGTLIYLAPSVHWQASSLVALALLVQVPVLQNLYGDQTEHVSVRAGISFAGR